MRKKFYMRYILVLLFTISSAIILFGCNTREENNIPYINDGQADWNNIKKITIISDGYYGRTVEEPLVIENTEEIESLVKKAVKADDYKIVPEEEYLEGMNSIFIDFGNGVVFSMYEDVNYGTISTQIEENGDSLYYFPKKFHKAVLQLLKDNEP